MSIKKAFKIITGTLVSFVGICLILILLGKFVFREQVTDYLNNILYQDRLETLRSAGPYTNENETTISFKYQQDSLQADSIFRYFRLDTLIRTDATTWENTLAIAGFINRQIPHANTSHIPSEKRNAIGLWEYHLHENPASNCRYHAILLHELLLASNITNRVVSCMPADSTDTDCHVINIVWLPEARKWTMIDSDQGAYITNSDNIPLSLEEMRQYAIEEKPMISHFLQQGKQRKDYLSYWTKNLYWFACREEAGYNKEVKQEGRHIYLLPEGFNGFRLREPNICTTTPSHFWSSPME